MNDIKSGSKESPLLINLTEKTEISNALMNALSTELSPRRSLFNIVDHNTKRPFSFTSWKLPFTFTRKERSLFS